METSDLAARLAKLETAVLADVMAAMGLLSQVLSPALRPVGGNNSFAGPALCASGSEPDPLGDNPSGVTGQPALSTFELDERVYPGAIVVIATNGCESGAIIGDNMATSMIGQGAAGFVIDGGIRDADALANASVPVFHRYRSPVSAHRTWAFRAFEHPVVLPGIWAPVRVCPGDLLLADADGIVCVPLAHAETIIAYGERHLQTEQSIKSAIEQGHPRRAATSGSGRLSFVTPIGGKATIIGE